MTNKISKIVEELNSTINDEQTGVINITWLQNKVRKLHKAVEENKDSKKGLLMRFFTHLRKNNMPCNYEKIIDNFLENDNAL